MIDFDANLDELVQKTILCVNRFYRKNQQIKESHGVSHAMAVYKHACHAVACSDFIATTSCAREILIASLLHDADDQKYFPGEGYKNARDIMNQVGIMGESENRILRMIDLVSCSKNGNDIPDDLIENDDGYTFLIPRWCDRLEAVGKQGVYRCYLYTKENGGKLHSEASPRPLTEKVMWQFATPERFKEYQKRHGTSTDMICHYYDKLLHVARPPPDLVKNSYLESQAQNGVQPLIELCLSFGRTGQVDETYLATLAT